LGGAIGGALGAKDPQLQLISMRNAIMRRLDPSDPAQQMKIAQEVVKYDPEFGMSIAENARKSAIQIKQASGAARQGITANVQEAERIALAEGLEGKAFETRVAELLKGTNKLSDKQATGARVAELTRILSPETGGLLLRPSERAALEAELATYERPEKERNIAFGTEAERKSKTMYGKPYADLTPEESGKVDAAVEASEQARAKASAIVLPGEKIEPKDYLRFNEYIDKTPTMTRTSSILSDAPTAIETIRMSTKNNFSSASLPAAIAKITGEGKSMSNQDIERYTRTGGLEERIAGDVVGFFTGKKTDITKAQAEQYAISLYRGALIERKKFIQDQAEQLGYDKSPNYETTIKQLDKKLEQFKLIKPSEQTRESLPKATTEVDTEKEKRYQQYKKDQLGENK